ncbi:hypothetical protein P4679_26535 [Priestia megaterium]|uniref:hypothetical protein n=1 Tax=Priestia megaterium TaxID=1404 RepID=UPI002E2265B0|nr:hypothetical protein [Priestia megaterium]
MVFKKYIVSFLAFILSTSLLLFIGHTFKIPILMFHYEYVNNKDEMMFATGSLLPFVIGLIVSYITEKTYIHRHQKDLFN